MIREVAASTDQVTKNKYLAVFYSTAERTLMQYLLNEDEYERLVSRSQALDEIDRIINEKPEDDEHGNAVTYSYRFDKTISRIMDTLDEVKIKELEEDTIKIPWFRNTEEMLDGLGIRGAK